MNWQTVPRANFMFLHAARLQAHYAAQWLARAARAYVKAQPDDRHTSLGWDDAFGGLTTHPLPDGSRLGLRIADLTLAFLDVHPHALPLDGRAEAEVRTWLGGHLAARNLAAGKLDDPLPYAMPDHVLARGARYSLDELGDALKVLAAWYANAHAALAGVQKHLAAQAAEGAAGALLAAPFRHGLLRCAAGAGAAWGSAIAPATSSATSRISTPRCGRNRRFPALPLLPAMAHWHTYKFLAAMAPAHKIYAALDQGAYVRQFLDVSVEAALHALRQG